MESQPSLDLQETGVTTVQTLSGTGALRVAGEFLGYTWSSEDYISSSTNLEQWEQIRQLIRSKAHLPFFDSACQGLASGSLDADAESVRLFTDDGGELLVAQSYAENMGLYGEPIGTLNMEDQHG
ncbi:hypothetical protein L6164_024149 [Bauhinia variegata]|uniref:Uncharacterized protein n=1 Tax=Bauhinia variegata TaxID=167791 RepID=A0ACB9LY18_BAUVA|nr:hypothetical protein L6164_024149 [Bauhinia variegata]